MEKLTQTEVEAQGAVDLSKIKEWMKRDLGFAISFLQALYTDPDMMDAVAQFMHGRLLNHKNQEALKNQTKLDI